MKMLLFFSIIAAVCVNATLKRKRKIKENKQPEATKQTVPRLKPESDEVDKYISEDSRNENSPKHLVQLKELDNERNYFVALHNTVFETVLESLRPREIVSLAQTSRKLLLKIISIDSYQYLRVEGLDIPPKISAELKKREIRYHPNWKVIIFNPNMNLPKEQQNSGSCIMAVVKAEFLKYFRFPKGSHKHDLENDEIFLCQLNDEISYIVVGKVFSKSVTTKISENSTYVLLRGIPIQVSNDRERRVVFFISNAAGGTFDLGALNTNHNPQLRDICGYAYQTDLEFVQRAFDDDYVKNMLAQKLRKNQI